MNDTEKKDLLLHEDFQALVRSSALLTKLVGAIKFAGGALLACVASLAGITVWVKGQTSGLVSAQSAIIAIESDRRATINEWTTWRRVKDENDVRFQLMAEAQQKLMERQQSMLDRILESRRE